MNHATVTQNALASAGATAQDKSTHASARAQAATATFGHAALKLIATTDVVLAVANAKTTSAKMVRANKYEAATA
jgi:hypothetical protein